MEAIVFYEPNCCIAIYRSLRRTLQHYAINSTIVQPLNYHFLTAYLCINYIVNKFFMLQQLLITLFERDLNKLRQEVAAYTSEADIWKVQDGITNSGGNLCLHLVGNLKHFVGKVLGNIPYERQRDKEFSDRDIPQSQLIQAIDETKEAVLTTLQSLSSEVLASNYPSNVFGYEMTTEYFLVHLYGHLDYHLGQINYHRRLLNREL